MNLNIGRAAVKIDEALCFWGLGEQYAAPFRFQGGEQVSPLKVLRRSEIQLGHPISGLREGETVGSFFATPNELHYESLIQPFAARAVLRAAWQIQVARAGGFLIHGSAVSFDGHSVIAAGPSGAGKSTLASFLMEAGGTLLSDEIIAVHPDGSVFGTPFRSSLTEPGSLGPGKLRAILLLKKGGEEKLDEVPAAQSVERLLSQVFRPTGGELSLPQALSRVTRVLQTVPVKELTFRKDPAAGLFVGRFVRETGNS